MEDVLKLVQSLGVGDQRRLLTNLLSSQHPDAQLTILIPALSAAPGYVKWRVSYMLGSHENPDLLGLLPPELQLAVLSYVDGPSLLQASLVSHSWHSLIKSHQKVWLRKCQQLGINLTPSLKHPPPSLSEGEEDWQRLYVGVARQAAALKGGRAFTHRYLLLNNCRTAIKAVDYKDGYLCTVSESDEVTIWYLRLNVAVLTFPCQRTVSCLCLHPASLLLCGHFTGILTSWDLSSMPVINEENRGTSTSGNTSSNTSTFGYPSSDPSKSSQSKSSNSGRSTFSNSRNSSNSGNARAPNAEPDFDYLKQKFKMHAGPVFSCDFSSELNLLVSGGADECLKLWCLSDGTILHSLVTREHWVLRVRLLPALSSHTSDANTRSSQTSRTNTQGSKASSTNTKSRLTSTDSVCKVPRHRVLYMTRQRVAKISWPASYEHPSEGAPAKSGLLVHTSAANLGNYQRDNSSDAVGENNSISTNTKDRTSVDSARCTVTAGNNKSDTNNDSQRCKYGNLNEISEDVGIPLNYDDKGIFTPGLQLSSKYLALVQQDIDEKSARLHLFDINTLASVKSFPLMLKVKKLLSLGDRYALLLTPGSVLYSSTLTIFDVALGKIAGSCSVPHSKMTTPDGVQIVVGEEGWLDGLGPHLPAPPLAQAVEPRRRKRYSQCLACINEPDIPGDNRKNEWVMGDHEHKSREDCSISNCINSPTCTDHLHLDPLSVAGESRGDYHYNHSMRRRAFEEKPKCEEANLKLSQGSFLVLAAGVQTEPGRLFTLWWTEAGQENKRKKD